MAYAPEKIHIGAGNTILNPDTDAIDLGLSSDGATLSYKGELEAIEADQFLAPVGYSIPGEECTFETIISEASAEKLKYAIGSGTVSTVAAGVGQKGYSKLTFGGNTVLTNYVLEYRAPKRTNRNLYIRVRLYIVNISPNLEMVFDKKKQVGFKLTCKAVCDVTRAAGDQLGYYMEETADVTGNTPTLAISSVVPADGANTVSKTSTIVVTFNREVDPATVNTGNFILIEGDGDAVACTAARTSSNVVTVTPNGALAGSQAHVFVVSSEVRAMDDKTKMAANGYYNFTTTA
jgi:hypothetical protein